MARSWEDGIEHFLGFIDSARGLCLRHPACRRRVVIRRSLESIGLGQKRTQAGIKIRFRADEAIELRAHASMRQIALRGTTNEEHPEGHF